MIIKIQTLHGTCIFYFYIFTIFNSLSFLMYTSPNNLDINFHYFIDLKSNIPLLLRDFPKLIVRLYQFKHKIILLKSVTHTPFSPNQTAFVYLITSTSVNRPVTLVNLPRVLPDISFSYCTLTVVLLHLSFFSSYLRIKIQLIGTSSTYKYPCINMYVEHTINYLYKICITFKTEVNYKVVDSKQ